MYLKVIALDVSKLKKKSFSLLKEIIINAKII